MGRYIERAENMARYTKVQYFSMFDAPSLQDRNFVLRSIVLMTDIDYDLDAQELDEYEILLKAGLDTGSDTSILYYVYSARENARSARNVLSDELWEAINTYHLFVQEYDRFTFKTTGLFDFSQGINKNSYIVKTLIDHTLLHMYGWLVINLGIHLERTIQIIRMLRTKLIDISILSNGGINPALEEYQWTITLKTLEAFDLYRRYIKNFKNGKSPMEFIIYHKSFTRSILYNLAKMHKIIQRLDKLEPGHNEMIYLSGKCYYNLKFSRFDELDDKKSFLDELLTDVYALHNIIAKSLFSQDRYTQIPTLESPSQEDNGNS